MLWNCTNSSDCSAGKLHAWGQLEAAKVPLGPWICLQGPAAALQRFGPPARSQTSLHAEEAEDLLRSELRSRLIPAASCAIAPSEASSRLEFYGQILMRPEVFGEDPAFPAMVATVCEQLDVLCGRLAGASRNCASLL